MARGLSLVEVMVAVAVIGVLLSVAIPSLADLMERRRVVAVAQELAGLLTFARSENNVNGDDVIVHLDNDPSGVRSCALVMTQAGAHGLCKCYRDRQTMCAPVNLDAEFLRLFQIENRNGVSFQASATRWADWPNTLSFARGRNFQNVVGFKVVVTGRRTGAQMQVEVSEANRVRTCSPGGSVGGYPACSS